MQIRLLTETEKQTYSEKIRKLCQISDTDFVPPLSQRSSTTQSILSGGICNGVDTYFQEILAQQILVCTQDEALLGFISFRDNYTPEHYSQVQFPNIYISTLILAPESRGMGLTKQLYHHLFFERFPDRNIYTRTWSTNAAHIRILSHFNFTELLRLPDHRGPGIDTVYYSLKRRK